MRQQSSNTFCTLTLTEIDKKCCQKWFFCFFKYFSTGFYCYFFK